MKAIHLFAGIGGFNPASDWMGWETVAWCEWDPFCQKVLGHYWPNAHFPEAHGHGDITKTDFTKYHGTIDIVTGGFPCQPFSVAGKREGSGDDRFLWPHTLRALTEIQPTYAIFENVFGLTSILESACETDVELQAVKLFSEGGDGDEVEERITEIKRRTISIIIDQLEEVGYTLPKAADGTPIILCVPACAVGAPHRRDRVWFVAHSTRFKNKWNRSTGFYAKPCRDGGNRKATDCPLERKRNSPSLEALGNMGMLPTPNASDNRDRGGPSNPAVARRMEIGKQVGLTMMVDGQLNPRFVGEMMGFPANWLELPFQNTETNP